MSKIDWTIFLQTANFLVLMLVLNFLLYRPVRGILKLRKAKIEGDYDKAKQLEQQINEKMTRYQDCLQEAKNKANQEKSAMRKSATEEQERILGSAREEATGHLQAIKNRVLSQAKEARSDLSKEAQTLASLVASKVLGRSL